MEIASGLDFLHTHGVIHRDIKCENVFVNLDMEGNIKKLAIGDFDTAKNIMVSKPKTIIGTLSYMAPEVYRSAAAYGHTADIFSYGVILYTIITLELPWGKNGLSFNNYEDIIAKPSTLLLFHLLPQLEKNRFSSIPLKWHSHVPRENKWWSFVWFSRKTLSSLSLHKSRWSTHIKTTQIRACGLGLLKIQRKCRFWTAEKIRLRVRIVYQIEKN